MLVKVVFVASCGYNNLSDRHPGSYTRIKRVTTEQSAYSHTAAAQSSVA